MSLKIILIGIAIFGVPAADSESCSQDFVMQLNSNITDVRISKAIDKNRNSIDCICALKMCLSSCSTKTEIFKNRSNITDVSKQFFLNFIQTNAPKMFVQENFSLFHDFYQYVKDDCQIITFLEAEKESSVSWIAFENGTFIRHCAHVCSTETEYCFELGRFMGPSKLNPALSPKICRAGKPIRAVSTNGYAGLVSIPFLLLTILIYACLDQLHDCHGKCYISFLSFLSLSYILRTFLFFSQWKPEAVACRIVGFTFYYMGFCYHTWACVISHYCWKTLQGLVPKGSYLRYAAVALLVPALLTMLSYIAQILPISDHLKPGIDNGHCVVNTRRWSVSIYYHLPFSIMFIYNMILYISMRKHIARLKYDASSFRNEDQKTNWKKSYGEFKLFALTGLYLLWTITLINLSTILRLTFHMQKPIFGVPDVFIIFQGPCLFLILISRRNIRSEIKAKFMKKKRTFSVTEETSV